MAKWFNDSSYLALNPPRALNVATHPQVILTNTIPYIKAWPFVWLAQKVRAGFYPLYTPLWKREIRA